MESGLIINAWEKLEQVSPDLFCSFDREGNFIYVSNTSQQIMGYLPIELVGKHYSEFLHPEYSEISYNAGQEILHKTKANNFENCFINKNGQLVYFLWSSVWCEQNQAFFSVGRDISELRRNQEQLKESEERYKVLFKNNPDVIFIENPAGLVTEVNNSFYQTLGFNPGEIINLPASAFLPSDMVSLSELALREALKGNPVRIEMTLFSNSREARTFDVSKYPITINNKVIGVQTIAKDITHLVQSFTTIKSQANKLNTIFESITDAFYTIDSTGRLTYLNKEAEKLLHINREKHLGKHILNIFPDEAGGEFHLQYLKAFRSGQSVQFTSFLRKLNLWLQVKVFPSKDGLSVYFEDVTEQVKIKEELEKLSLVASKTTNGVVITNKEDRVEWVNESFTKLTGYTLDEIRGKKPADFLRGSNTNLDTKTLNELFEYLLMGQPVSFEIQNFKKNGEVIWFSVQVSPIIDHTGDITRFVAIHTDISERKKEQEELEKLSLVANKTTHGVIITDATGKIEWINEGYTKMTGYSLLETSGAYLFDLLDSPETTSEDLIKLKENLEKKNSFNATLKTLTKKGEGLWLSMDFSPVWDQTGNLQKYIALQKNITYRKEAETNLLKLSQDLYKQNRDLEQFTYIVSHNLRLPVANALGIVEILTSLNKDSTQYDMFLSNLKQSVMNLDLVLKDMNTILKLRDNKNSLANEEVPLKSVLSQAQNSLSELLYSCGGSIITNFTEDLLLKVNKAFLYSVFFNLLSNAIKYRSDYRALTIKINCHSHTDKGVLLSFSDNGSGFELEKAKPNLFKLYKRFHSEKKGRGIGLFLTKAHIEAMGGHIEVTSKVNFGTSFLIFLPKV
ncbi:PAS domain S-box protein [Adhaeribacter aquaticus]|uniref:PAS domain S-box protein n=1 Tax=Adhaeribacter aquaticus TaxID=299567 RepID=UPI0003FC539B|nr:PAS domain S-box protein [Adhaeribacter aquaticus]